jgi:hypothetical protein
MKTYDLLAMLKYKRPAGSATEAKYINRYIRPTGAEPDNYGNYHLVIGDKPKILFSSHTDTVHSSDGKQRIKYDSSQDIVTSIGNDCLGADDTTGNWLMLAMIEAKVEGYYIFHREEEVGGGGSSFVASMTPEKLEGIEHAVAFDRMGTSDVITSQCGRCCSSKFAGALAELLGKKWGSNFGIFTDTANYTHLVAECTNISVGYENQHTAREFQRIGFANKLRDKLIELDWASLPTDRDPKTDDFGFGYYGGYHGGYHGGYSGKKHTRSYRGGKYKSGFTLDSSAANTGSMTGTDLIIHGEEQENIVEDMYILPVGSPFERLVEAIENHSPEHIASIMYDWGIDADYINDYGQ